MSKKIVRGITDIKTINNQDFDTNNVNDLLSDGKNNYIHRKKSDGTEEYHNLTNNLKTLQSDDTDLLTVTNYNNTTNSATIRPKHDSQKEQLLESTDETILISHGENGTEETTTVDVNPAKVLKHDNLQTSYGLSKTKSGNNLTLGLEYTRITQPLDLDTLTDGLVRSNKFINAPKENTWFYVSTYSEGNYCIQRATELVNQHNTSYVRRKDSGVWGEWREQTGDKSVIDSEISELNSSVTTLNTDVTNINHRVANNSAIAKPAHLEGLYPICHYSHAGYGANPDTADLRVYYRDVIKYEVLDVTHDPSLEINFMCVLGNTIADYTFYLTEYDARKFELLFRRFMDTPSYEEGKQIVINGLVFSLTGNALTVSRTSEVKPRQVVSFSYIL